MQTLVYRSSYHELKLVGDTSVLLSAPAMLHFFLIDSSDRRLLFGTHFYNSVHLFAALCIAYEVSGRHVVDTIIESRCSSVINFPARYLFYKYEEAKRS